VDWWRPVAQVEPLEGLVVQAALQPVLMEMLRTGVAMVEILPAPTVVGEVAAPGQVELAETAARQRQAPAQRILAAMAVPAEAVAAMALLGLFMAGEVEEHGGA